MLAGKWAPARNDADHQKAVRLFSAGSLRGWVPTLRDAIALSWRLYTDDEGRRVFNRELEDRDWQMIDNLLSRLLSHKVWLDADLRLGDLKYDDARRAKEIAERPHQGWILGPSRRSK